MRVFNDLCGTFQLHDLTHEEIKLKIFSYTPSNDGLKWLQDQPAGTLSTWKKLSSMFLACFYPQGKLYKMRRKIGSFGQRPGESLVASYKRYRSILSECPDHYYPPWLVLHFF